jgi:hypothetical protein
MSEPCKPVGISGNTPADMREIAAIWDESAKFCEEHEDQFVRQLAARDRRLAAGMRLAADILEKAGASVLQ